MKKTLNNLNNYTYKFDTSGQHTVRISNTLSALTLVGNKNGYVNDLQTQLTSIQHIGTNIEQLGNYCCYNCSNLVNVNLPIGTKSFGDYCFANCQKLNDLNIFKEQPNSVYGIGDHAFENTNLENINIDLRGRNYKTDEDYEGCVATTLEDGPYAGDYSFANCKKLKSVKLITSTELGNHMFDGCSELTNVEFANHGSCVGSYAFANCSKLQSIAFPRNFEVISEYMFDNCSELNSVIIPTDAEKFTTIENNAFNNCNRLTQLTLPKCISEVEMLQDKSFAGSKLNRITFSGISKDELIKYSGMNKITYTPFSIDKTTVSDFKLGKWYGDSGSTTEAAIKFAKKKNIPMVFIWCNTGCGLCTTLKKKVLSTEACQNWVIKSKYLFVYYNYSDNNDNNLSFARDIFYKNVPKMSSVGFPAFVAYWNGKPIDKWSRGVYDKDFTQTFCNRIDNAFKGWTNPDNIQQGSVTLIPKTKQFTGFGLDHDCDIYSSDNVHFKWDSSKNALSCFE